MPRGGLRVLLGAFGDPGHAFPALALGRALRARGHEVLVETWERWREHAEDEGLAFAPAPEYHVFPTRERPLKPYEAVARAVGVTRPLVASFAPDVVVADVLTLAPALAAELEGVPAATVIPHVDPRAEPGWPPYSIGARLPRTRAGRALWRRLDPLVGRGLALGRAELNETRRRLGLPALAHVHGGISRELALVATFPQLEYPRRAPPPATHVVGPLLWEPPFGDVEPPDGPADRPVVLVAPSTSQDPGHRLLRAALAGLAELPVRVLATTNRRPLGPPAAVPRNARLVDWVSYSRTMPRCDVVVCHGGHGTVARALQAGCVVVAAPAAGDMNENAARIDWAGVGVRIPRRLVTPRVVGLAVERALAERRYARRAAELAEWVRGHDPPARAAQLVEELAARTGTAGGA
ncbi:MAG TPA: nucleotide disphospho-sugar-binding domain-containing protein [Solirubrobacteraceae bacterium]|nr:nucleotide disphospho-sugar-binding domain-containing protein [Solirubrobacteraceae bacterium]